MRHFNQFTFSATALLVLLVVVANVDAQTSDVTVALVLQGSPATVDSVATLPISESGFEVGATLYLEVWARTQATSGLSQLSTDISFDPEQLSAVSITHTSTFSLFPSGTIDNATGLIDDLSGSVAPTSPPCTPQIGVTDWARVAEVELVVISGSAGTVQSNASNSPIFVVATCGSFDTPTVEYLGVGLGTAKLAHIELVSLAVQSSSDSATVLPTSQTDFIVGDTYWIEMWAQTTSSDGLSQVSADIIFDPTVSSVQSLTITSAFSLFQNGSVNNTNGILDNVSGSAPAVSPPCSGQVGASPNWARVAVIEVLADDTSVGSQTFQAMDSSDSIFVVATCGDFVPPVTDYGSVTVSTSCLIAQPVSLEPSPVDKSRFISFIPGNAGEQTALRVTLTSIDLFGSFSGQVRWVGAPIEYQEGANPTPTFMGASLQCTPHYQDWGGIDLLHVFGAAVVPSSNYEIQVIHETCDVNDEFSYSSVLPVSTGKWGDVVAPFSTPQLTQPDIGDVLSVVDKWLGTLVPRKARSQLQPNIPNPTLGVSIADVIVDVDAWLGSPYGYDGPTTCP